MVDRQEDQAHPLESAISRRGTYDPYLAIKEYSKGRLAPSQHFERQRILPLKDLPFRYAFWIFLCLFA